MDDVLCRRIGVGAGKHADVLTGLVNSWKPAGYTTIDASIGYEMNGKLAP